MILIMQDNTTAADKSETNEIQKAKIMNAYCYDEIDLTYMTS